MHIIIILSILASFIGVAIILGSMYDLLHTKHFVGSQVKPTSNILPGVEDDTLTQGNFKGENVICAKRLKPLLQETKINEAKMNPSDIERTETEHLINSASKHKGKSKQFIVLKTEQRKTIWCIRCTQ